MVPPAELDGLTHADLKSLVLKLLEQVAELQRTVAAQRDEIARLKGGPGRPNIRPSGMEQATEAKPAGSNRRRPRGGTRSKLSIDEERTVKVAAPPRGSRFKGYTSFLVQDLMIRRHVVNFRREHWLTADGKMVKAPLPASVQGHFGPELRRFVLAQYHQGQVTVPRLVTLLRALGILISKRQVMRLLNKDHPSTSAQDGFLAEARDLLRAGHGDYVVNAEALAYMRERALAAHVMARLAEHPDRWFADQEAWNAHLEKLGISALKSLPPRRRGSIRIPSWSPPRGRCGAASRR